MEQTFIFDLDGLLADCQHRVHLVTADKPNWDAFYNACSRDLPIRSSFAVYHALRKYGYRIVVSTGRVENVRDKSVEWMLHNNLAYPHELLMRPDADYCKDVELKARHVAWLRSNGCTIVGAFDDRQRVIELYHSLGIPAYHLDSTALSQAVDAAEDKGE